MRKLNQIVHNYAIFYILKYHFCYYISCLSQIFINFVIAIFLVTKIVIVL